MSNYSWYDNYPDPGNLADIEKLKQCLMYLRYDHIPSSPHGQKVFTSNGTFIVPNGVTTLLVTLVAGGGGAKTGGGIYVGGGGDCKYKVPVSVTPLQSIPVTIGQSGTLSASPTAGGTSSFGALLSAVGGGAGTAGNGSAGGTGATAGVVLNTGATSAIAIGGGNILGRGGIATDATAISTMVAIGYGSGAVCAGNYSAAATAGICIIEW